MEGSDVHDVTLKRDGANQSLGFSIRGGSEHGLGVYVSDVTPDSIAGGYSAGVLITRYDHFVSKTHSYSGILSLICTPKHSDGVRDFMTASKLRKHEGI